MSNVENILANATDEQIIDARDWASDCIGLTDGKKVSAERAIKYIEKNYPGGWAGFLAEIFPVQPEAVQPATKRCDTIGCKAPATHQLVWRDEFDLPWFENVCEPCGQGYAARPRLKATLRPMEGE